MLHVLAQYHPGCDPDFLQKVINHPTCDPNQLDLQGNTPIMTLLRQQQSDVRCRFLQVLVEQDKVKLDLQDPEGLSFEDHARYKMVNEVEIIRLLHDGMAFYEN